VNNLSQTYGSTPGACAGPCCLCLGSILRNKFRSVASPDLTLFVLRSVASPDLTLFVLFVGLPWQGGIQARCYSSAALRHSASTLGKDLPRLECPKKD
jgi:hypothetical protein